MASDEPSDKRVRAEAASVCLCAPDSPIASAYLAGYRQGRESIGYLLDDVRRLESGRATLQRELDEARAEARRARQENAVDGYHAELMRIKAALRAAESENTRLRGHQFQAAIDACRQKQHSARRAGDYARGSTGIDLTVHDDAADAFERVANWLASRSAQPDPERWLGEDGDPLRLAAPEYTEPTRPDPEREARRRLGEWLVNQGDNVRYYSVVDGSDDDGPVYKSCVLSEDWAEGIRIWPGSAADKWTAILRALDAAEAASQSSNELEQARAARDDAERRVAEMEAELDSLRMVHVNMQQRRDADYSTLLLRHQTASRDYDATIDALTKNNLELMAALEWASKQRNTKGNWLAAQSPQADTEGG